MSIIQESLVRRSTSFSFKISARILGVPVAPTLTISGLQATYFFSSLLPLGSLR